MKFNKWLIKLSLPLLGGYVLIQNRMLKTENYKIKCSRLPKGFEGCRIVLLADLHKKTFGYGDCNLINSVAAAQPDLIFFSGDLYSRSEKKLMPKLKLMKRLSKLAPVYYAAGNHELGDIRRFDLFCKRLKGLGIHVLRNRSEKIYRGGDSADVYGAELPLEYYVDPNGGFKHISELTGEKLTELLGSPKKTACTMLIAHDPLFLKAYSRWGADIVFSGHVHGGMIRLPVVGGLLSPERKFFPRYTKGLYKLGRTTMALTAGLGRFRLNNPSQIMLITLTRDDIPVKRPKGEKWFLDVKE